MTPVTDTTLIVKRTFQAPREEVFDAWTSQDILRRWFGPMENSVLTVEHQSATVGGTYQVRMTPEERKMNVIYGKYVEVNRPERLVFTWAWEGEEGETQVTVTFKSLGDATEIILKHEHFATLEQRDAHERGWLGCFKRFDQFFQ